MPAYNPDRKSEIQTHSEAEGKAQLLADLEQEPDTLEREVILQEKIVAEKIAVKAIKDTDEDTKERKIVSTIPSTGSLSIIEKIAISCLCAALALGAILTLIHFSNRVPTRPLVAEEIDFPVSGKIVEITAASTYWRKPITTGDTADVVRRGTQLIPVLKLSLNSKSGAIRVFFRNEDGLVVGDGITRSVKGNTEVIVPATAGFDDVGMHTAYRTGDGKRWIVQVFEAPSAKAPGKSFRKILETEIAEVIK